MVMNAAERFTAKAVAAGAEVFFLETLSEAVRAVEDFLSAQKMSKCLASAAFRSAAGDKMHFSVFTPRTNEEYAEAEAGIVVADSGVAETGTLVHLDFDDGEKMTWTLPPVCLCLLDTTKIVETVEALAPVFSGHLARDLRPAPQVSLVTGPSRTADIECLLSIGVHGPSRLVIFLIGEPAP